MEHRLGCSKGGMMVLELGHSWVIGSWGGVL